VTPAIQKSRQVGAIWQATDRAFAKPTLLMSH
jgi:hypothetical protein